MDTTACHALPLIAPGQAQKELAHNEALALIDAALHPAIVEAARNDPPPSPRAGQRWLVGTQPVGGWTGQAGAVAVWTAGGWRFVAATEGMTAWDAADRVAMRHAAGIWRRPGTVAAPAGGGVIDGEARAAIVMLSNVLRAQGLLAP